MTTTLVHLLTIAIAIGAYVALTVTGHDGNPVFVFIGGQGVGALIQKGTSTPDVPSYVPPPDRSTIK